MYEQVDEKRTNNVPRLQTTYVGWKSRASPDKRLRMIRHHSNNRHPNPRHLEFRRSGKQISSPNKFPIILSPAVLIFRVKLRSLGILLVKRVFDL